MTNPRITPPSPDPWTPPAERTRLGAADRPEAEVVQLLLDTLSAPRPAEADRPPQGSSKVAKPHLLERPQTLHWPGVVTRATPWVEAVRAHPAPFWALDSLMREYPISSAEGLALMRLAEALLRVPDLETAIALTADQLGRAAFDAEAGGDHALMARLSNQAIALSKRWLPDAADTVAPGLLHRLGAQTVVAATVRAIQLMGRQFVLGQTLPQAQREADALRRRQAQLRFSYDMLGEGARTDDDARAYAQAYAQAIAQLAAKQAQASAGGQGLSPQQADGISIKLSALDARFEPAQRAQVFAVLLPRLWPLVDAAARGNLNLTIDAEESERLELSLDVFEALATRIAVEHPGWSGFGLAVQAYQTRSLDVVHEVTRIAAQTGLRFMVRLVKGAYWDAEIKRAQELGLAAYPVFTHKHHTDIAYLACAQALLQQAPRIYAQFASHNAATLAAVLQLVQRVGGEAPHSFELQRLHGMGEGVYREVLRDPALHCRVYAPVGKHRDLLAYLVRRLLENGANSSFVHQLADASISPSRLLELPLRVQPHSGQPLPRHLYGPQRDNAWGRDLAILAHREPLQQAVEQSVPPPYPHTEVRDIDALMIGLHAAWPTWEAAPLSQRCRALQLAADALEARLPWFVGLLVQEGRKTLADAVAEVREAVDFCRYYAVQAQATLVPQTLPGPTGERNTLNLRGRGVFVCISPWNFPLAIFAGQVVAALVCGNAVAAKPAEQTPAVARAFVDLLHECGVPRTALAWVHGAGDTVGAALVAHPLTAGVCFTGSTAVGKHIQRALAAGDGPIVPLIAETGGLNAMLVDPTALPEQVVDAVVQSAFRSAGQRCSALRLLCIHASIADPVLDMLAGAMHTLVVGDAADWRTDVGPLIDAEAKAGVAAQLQRLDTEARLIARTPLPVSAPLDAVAPAAFELERIEDLQREIFGPVLHVVRWQGAPEAVIDRINALGYGLTLGLQTRIDRRAEVLGARARVGNVYVNRNIIGAVVGVQPFGGEGRSGSGPKAGGPHYLLRFCSEQTVSVNTAAAGGNADLLSGPTQH